MGLFKKAAKALKKVAKNPLTLGADSSLLQKTGDFVKENTAELFMFGPQIGTGFGLYKGYGASKAKKAQKKAAENERRLLLRSLDKMEDVDKQSLEEARTLLLGGRENLGRAQSLLEDARLGVQPKYKARKATEALYQLMVDQPGSRQTRDTGVASLLMGNQFMGRGR